jgi:NO-binding membrane sensor protein with MHYT domain
VPAVTDRPARRSTRTGMALRVIGALALGFSGYLHLRIALERPPLFADGQVTLSALFIAQAVAATVVVLWVLLRGDLLAWLAFGAVALGSLVALVASVYVRIPSVGPFPVIYEPFWYLDKNLSAIAAAIASLVALVAVLQLRRSARR